MKRTIATRTVKCQICKWHGTRVYGSHGILVDPCPESGHRVTYAVTHPDDQPVTPNSGVPVVIDPARAARRAQLAENLRKARAARIAQAVA